MKWRVTILKVALAVLPMMLMYSTAQAGDTNRGRQLYGKNCAVCHGDNGRSVMPGAPNFNRGETLLRPDSALLLQIRNGKNACPAYRGMLSDRDILDVIAFLRTLH